MNISKISDFLLPSINLQKIQSEIIKTRNLAMNIELDKFDITPVKLCFSEKNWYEQNIHKKIINSLPDNQKILSAKRGPFPWYTVERTIHSNKGYTDWVCDCLAIIIHNKKDGFLMHINPLNYQKGSQKKIVKKSINEYISTLRKFSKQKVEAFIFGGQKEYSVNLKDFVTSIFKKNHCQTSHVLFPYDKQGHTIYYNLPQKKIVIDHGIYRNLDELKQNFEVVHLIN